MITYAVCLLYVGHDNFGVPLCGGASWHVHYVADCARNGAHNARKEQKPGHLIYVASLHSDDLCWVEELVRRR